MIRAFVFHGFLVVSLTCTVDSMCRNEQEVQECDATKDESSTND